MLEINLKGQVGIVTGAGSPYGIGRSYCLYLAKAGARAIYVGDLNVDNIDDLQKTVKENGSDTQIYGRILDVSSEKETVSLLQEILRKHGRFDFFFANAGYAILRNIEDLEPAQYDRMIQVMQRAPFLAVKYGSKAMAVTSKEKPECKGSIVVTSSAAGLHASWSDLAYSTAKAGAAAIVRSGAVQLATSKIRVNGIAPGATSTSIFTTSKESEGGETYHVEKTRDEIIEKHIKFCERAGLITDRNIHDRSADPDEMGFLGAYLASDAASSINGQVILADSGKTGASLSSQLLGEIPPIKPLQF